MIKNQFGGNWWRLCVHLISPQRLMYLHQADDKCGWNATVRSMVAVDLQLLVKLLSGASHANLAPIWAESQAAAKCSPSCSNMSCRIAWRASLLLVLVRNECLFPPPWHILWRAIRHHTLSSLPEPCPRSFMLSDPGGTQPTISPQTLTVHHQRYIFSYNFNLTFRRRSFPVELYPPLNSIAAASRVDAASKAAYSAVATGRHYELWWLVTSTKGTRQPSGQESGCSTVFFFFFWLTQETTSIICYSYGLSHRNPEKGRFYQLHHLSDDLTYIYITFFFLVFRKKLAEAQPLYASFFFLTQGELELSQDITSALTRWLVIVIKSLFQIL